MWRVYEIHFPSSSIIVVLVQSSSTQVVNSDPVVWPILHSLRLLFMQLASFRRPWNEANRL